MGKLELLWGRVEKNKKFARKNKKNLLGGSLTVALPWEGEGVPLPLVSPDTRQKHTQSPFANVTNVTHTNETHLAIYKPLRSLSGSPKTYILIVKYT